MSAMLSVSLDTAGWWIEAHPGLVLVFHAAVIVAAVAGVAASARVTFTAVRARPVRALRLAMSVVGGLTALVVVVLFTGGAVKIGPRLLIETSVLGQDATRLRFRGVEDDKVHRLEPRDREIVLVALWATWCQACLEEFEPLARLHRAPSGRNLRIVHLSQEDPATIRAFLADHPGYDFGSLHGYVEPDAWFPAAKLPTVLIVGGDGRIAGLLRGSTSYEQLTWAIARARESS